jgi:hypothetical protein
MNLKQLKQAADGAIDLAEHIRPDTKLCGACLQCSLPIIGNVPLRSRRSEWFT